MHVDDIVMCAENEEDHVWVKQIPSKQFKFRDMGEIKETLGIEVKRTGENVYSMSQTKCIEKMCEKCDVTLKKRANTPTPKHKD